ncbi:cold-regulated protein 27-like isoform X1 [Tasmannia lanceolata]|uniref:cold-regulated protein 27-like isoform X1 n=2 Tax=Tasmannia lanceolata TaxID=3420 RepID=UPI004063BDE8
MEGDLGHSNQAMNGRDGENNLRDFSGLEDKGNLGHQMVESLPNEWTDEKHRSYLNSIEASFVKQLHNYEHRLMDSHDWLSRRQKLLDRKSSPSNPNTNSSSGQFKVFCCGLWKKPEFEKAQTLLDTENESRVLLANPWIQHFRSASSSKGLEVTSLKLQENGETIHVEGRKNATTTLKQFSACYSSINQDSVSSTTEVSDQNFVDESCGSDKGKNLSNPCRKKRARTRVADVSGKNQVVPLGQCPITANPNENYTFQRRKYRDYRRPVAE